MRFGVITAILCSFIGTGLMAAEKAKKLARPKLIIGVAADQMRWDYLYKFYDRYGEGGFKRLLNEGFTFENTFINHRPSVTAVGHATLFTGTVPAVHGITANNLQIQADGTAPNAVEDKDVQGVECEGEEFQRSPKNMFAGTIGDELRLATNFRAKVIGVSLKDRAAILPAGHSANAAYWLDKKTGKMITSTYYMNELPAWVKAFNAEKRVQKFIEAGWNTLYPIETYIQSSPDDAPWEGGFKVQGEDKNKSKDKKELSAVFPYDLKKYSTPEDYSVFYNTPFGNTMTLDFAKETIAQEKLGQGDETDMLTINFACTDSVGHQFSVSAIEVEDVYLRLDKDLEAFFNFLDEKIGKGQYTFFLSADHGGNHNAQFLNEHKLRSNPNEDSNITKELNQLLEDKFGQKNLIINNSYQRISFDQKAISEKSLDEDAIVDVCVKYLQKNPTVAFVADMNQIGDASIPALIKTKMVNGYNKERSGRVQYINKPYHDSLRSRGTGHKDWNPYDTKLPNVWMGWGVKHGRSFRTVHQEDLAPTATSLLRIQTPNAAIGETLYELFDHSAFED